MNAHAWRKEGLFGEKKFDLWLLLILSNALNRANNKDCSLSALLFLSYHLIHVPWFDIGSYLGVGSEDFSAMDALDSDNELLRVGFQSFFFVLLR